MIIDVHNHPDWLGRNLDRFIEDMDDRGIDVTWILSWVCPENEYDPSYHAKLPDVNIPGGPVAFSRCVDYVEKAPDRFVLGYAPDPRAPEAIPVLRNMIGLYGVRVCGEIKLRMMYDDWDAVRLYRFCGENGLPVLVHIDYELPAAGGRYPRDNWWYGGGIAAFERAVAACPETIFIGHAPGFWAHISGDGRHLREAYPAGAVAPGGDIQRMLDIYPNLYCDLSGNSGCNALRRDPEHAARFLLRYQDRILYGRDDFNNHHQEFLASLDLPAPVLRKIYCENALRLVPLDVRGAR